MGNIHVTVIVFFIYTMLVFYATSDLCPSYETWRYDAENHKCYRFQYYGGEKRSWNDARADCQQCNKCQNTSLVSIHDNATNEFLKQFLLSRPSTHHSSKGPYWVGGYYNGEWSCKPSLLKAILFIQLWRYFMSEYESRIILNTKENFWVKITCSECWFWSRCVIKQWRPLSNLSP